MPFSKGHPGGPGRPKKRDLHAGAIAKAEKQIRDKLPSLIENMIKLADGVFVEEYNVVTGARQVYQEKPDRAANEYLINRILGKPTERKEHTFPKPLNEMTDDELRAIAES